MPGGWLRAAAPPESLVEVPDLRHNGRPEGGRMAAWEDAPDIVDTLVGPPRAFGWTEPEPVCGRLGAGVKGSEEPCPQKAASRVLKELRRKRQVALMASVADALMGSGRNEAEIQREYAQA